MKERIIRYFAEGNTAKGFYSFYDSCFQDIEKLFIILGTPGNGKSAMMEQIGMSWLNNGYNVEYIYSARENDTLDGVKNVDKKIGIVDGTLPRSIKYRAIGAVEHFVDLTTALDNNKIYVQREPIMKLHEEMNQRYQQAYHAFAEGLKVHDELEKIYISNMDFEAAEKLTNQLIQMIFTNKKAQKKSGMVHRFLGAATPKGAVDFIPNLTEDLGKRYFIKGRAGSGKSTMLRKIGAEGEKRGFHVEYYHCGFDPKSIDMVIIRELDTAIFDSTAPHEHFPTRKGDEIVELYGTVIKKGTDEKFAKEIVELTNLYKSKMKEGTHFLKKAKTKRDELKNIYKDAIHFNEVDEIKKRLMQQLL